MGTRGLIGVVIENQPKAVYNHFDSYPSGLGCKAVAFAQTLDLTDVSAVRKTFAKIKIIDENGVPTAAEEKHLRSIGIAPQQVSSGEDWYAWLRDAQGDLTEYARIGFMPDSTSFGEDSLFCEWGYLINLDNLTLEVYEGFQKTQPTEGFWKDYDPKAIVVKPGEYINRDYYGIARVAVFDLATVTETDMTDLEARLRARDEEEEETKALTS
jgi:hypothetical protein